MKLDIRISLQQPTTGAYHDDRYRLDDLDERDAAAIRAGKAVLLEIAVRRKMQNRPAEPLDVLHNFVGKRDLTGVYAHPEHIHHPYARQLGADMWSHQFGLRPGMTVRHAGRIHIIEHLEDVDREHAEQGWLTGYAMCRRTDPTPSQTIRNPQRLPLHELTPITAKG